jgi:vesicle-fusing ATPase
MQPGELGINSAHRRWAQFSLGQPVVVAPYNIYSEAGGNIYLASMTLEVDFLKRSMRYQDQITSEDLAEAFSVVKLDDLCISSLKGLIRRCL